MSDQQVKLEKRLTEVLLFCGLINLPVRQSCPCFYDPVGFGPKSDHPNQIKTLLINKHGEHPSELLLSDCTVQESDSDIQWGVTSRAWRLTTVHYVPQRLL